MCYGCECIESGTGFDIVFFERITARASFSWPPRNYHRQSNINNASFANIGQPCFEHTMYVHFSSAHNLFTSYKSRSWVIGFMF